MRSLLSIVGVLSALQVVSVVAQDPVPPCVAECASQVRADFPKYTCASADDKACLCPSQDFQNGIRDCASQKCGGTEANVQAYLSSDFCLNVAPAAPTSASAPAPPSSASEPPPESTAPPSSEPPAPASTSAPAETTSQPPSTTSQVPETSAPAATTSVESSAAPPTTTQPTSTDAESTSSTLASSTSSTSAASSTTAAPSDEDDDDKSEKDKNEKEDNDETKTTSGLSTAAKVGIAVGIVAAVLAALVVAWCVLRRRKQQPKRMPLEISKPIAGSRAGYGPSDDAHYEKYGDIEMTTRYEDMLPRQQPRTMV